MSVLLNLPSDVASYVLEWLYIDDLTKLDSSLPNSGDCLLMRDTLLSLFKIRHSYSDKCILSRPENNFHFLKWISLRKIKLECLRLNGDCLRCGAIPMIDLSMVKQIEFKACGNSNIMLLLDLCKVCPALEEIFFEDLPLLSDWHIESLDRSVLKKIKSIEFKHCNGITVGTLYILALVCQNLRFVTIENCDLLSYCEDEFVLGLLCKSNPHLVHLSSDMCLTSANAVLFNLWINCPNLKYLSIVAYDYDLLLVRRLMEQNNGPEVLRIISEEGEPLFQFEFATKSLIVTVWSEILELIALVESCNIASTITALELNEAFGLSDEILSRLVLNNRKTLSSLVLNGYNRVTANGLRNILRQCSFLVNVSLRALNQLSNDDIKVIFVDSAHLTAISILSHDSISNECIIAIVKACSRLKTLTVYGCGCVDTDMVHKVLVEEKIAFTERPLFE